MASFVKVGSSMLWGTGGIFKGFLRYAGKLKKPHLSDGFYNERIIAGC